VHVVVLQFRMSAFGSAAATTVHLPPIDLCLIQLTSVGWDCSKPARMPARLDPHPHPPSLARESAIKLFHFLTVLQSPFLELPTVRIHKRNLLKARVVVCSLRPSCKPSSTTAAPRKAKSPGEGCHDSIVAPDVSSPTHFLEARFWIVSSLSAIGKSEDICPHPLLPHNAPFDSALY
jgi:hypothetical protein